MRTRTLRDRMIACGVVLAWHGALAWVLLRGLQVDAPGGDPAPMLATFIAVAPPPQPAPMPAPRAGRRQRVDAPGPRAQVPRLVAVDVPTATPARPQGDPTPLQLQVQVEAVARAASPIRFGPRDPFAGRPAALAGDARAYRFRMRPSVSPLKRVVSMIGMVTGGVDARTARSERCARIHDNLATLAVAGASIDRRDALDNDDLHCRP